jgi:hypothetical protein
MTKIMKLGAVGLFLAVGVGLIVFLARPPAQAAPAPTVPPVSIPFTGRGNSQGASNLATRPAGPTMAAPLATAATTRVPTHSPTRGAPQTSTRLPTQIVPALPTLDPAVWKSWPVFPGAVSAQLRQAYQEAVARGSIDPQAFSVFGDCQSEADSFLGVFDTSPALVNTMNEDLQDIVAQFSGSFYRYNPAAKSGSSAGSLLYAPWNDNKEGKCQEGETPVDCELRVHQPSIVFIHLGTHFEPQARNLSYLTTIVEKILATGAVPIMVTKADHLEGSSEYVNLDIATLAVKYQLPVWNFWASVQELPDQGLQPAGMLLTKDGTTVHQVGALRMLGLVWEAVR